MFDENAARCWMIYEMHHSEEESKYDIMYVQVLAGSVVIARMLHTRLYPGTGTGGFFLGAVHWVAPRFADKASSR